MRFRVLVGGLCAAVMLLVASGAYAQPQVYNGRSIPPDGVKAFTIVTDASTIVEVVATANNARTDLDIMITTEEDGEEVVIADSRSGLLQYEVAAAGLIGATTYKVMITNVDGPSSRWTLIFSSPAGVDVTAGARFAVRDAGEFMLDGPVEPEFLGVQRLLQERRAKR
jgi:hypothetical protein